MLEEYVEGRHWRGGSLDAAVIRGNRLEETIGPVSTWLTCTNVGVVDICRVALRVAGIDEDELATGYLCDPASKPTVRISARLGIRVSSTRNFDKARGFANGVFGTVCESLRGNAIFIVKLHGVGDLVLVHPMEEDGARFLLVPLGSVSYTHLTLPTTPYV